MTPGAVDLRATKAEVERGLPPTHPGRLLLAGLPDELPVATFDLVAPAIVRALRARGPEGP